ncbi:MAG TPA: hypothetical protein VIS94_12220 [Desulfomonilia bacterium]
MESSEILNQVRVVFDPLAKSLGLQGPIVMALGYTTILVGYHNNAVGLEIEIDLSDFFLFALIYRSKENKIPIGYNDDKGLRQKIFIQDALKMLSIDIAKETKTLQKLGGDYHNCTQMAEILAKIISQYWNNIVTFAPQLFG